MADGFTVKSLSAAHRAKLASFKPKIKGMAEQFSGFRAKVKDIAPIIMAYFDELLKVHGAELGGFVGFCRLFNPDMPEKAGTPTAPGYRADPTYYTLDYIKRSTQKRKTGQQGKRDPATDSLARMLATILQVVKDDVPVWLAVKQEFGLTDRAISRLKTRVEDAEPILSLEGVKPVGLTTARIIHMEPIRKGATAQQAGKLDLTGKGGRRVKAA